MNESNPPDRDPGSNEAAPRLAATVNDRGNAIQVALSGELDLATLGVAEDAFKSLDAGSKKLVIDLRRLSFLDSSGLRLVLQTADAAEKAGGEVFVIEGPAQVNRVFELTGAGERLNLVGDPSSIGIN